MRTRCPYPECSRNFEVAFELPDADWHWRSGTCPFCEQPASFRPLSVLDEIDRQNQWRQLQARSASQFPIKTGGEEPSLSALLEDVRSLFNVGSILRTADGAGVLSVYLCGITGCPPRKEISKASLGAEEFVSWQYQPGAVAVLRALKERGVQTLALERTSHSLALSQVLARQLVRAPVCLVVGNEVMGLSAETLSLCDTVCHLPMHGRKESLNVAVAFGIASYSLSDYLDSA
jgi:tRNA G18 (ribose-2'-O)-methylase SpoU